MAWSSPAALSPGGLITASMWNSHCETALREYGVGSFLLDAIPRVEAPVVRAVIHESKPGRRAISFGVLSA